MYNSRIIRPKAIGFPSPRVSRTFTIVANFLPFVESHQCLWLRTKDSLDPSPHSSSRRSKFSRRICRRSPCSPCETSYLILWTLKRRSTTTVSNTVMTKLAAFVAALTPFPRFPGIRILSVAGWREIDSHFN